MRFMKSIERLCILVISTLVYIFYRIFWISFFFPRYFISTSPSIVWGASPSIGLVLIQQFGDVAIKPIPIQLFGGHGLGPGDPASADPVTCPAGTLECLVHIPLGAGVEEGERITCLQRLVVHDPHLHAAHVEDQ